MKTQIAELLPIPTGVKTPTAYQVFGLDTAEQDLNRVAAAVEQVLRRLESDRGRAEPAVWKKAVEIARKAESVLKDPVKKAKLDARFGVVNSVPNSSPPVPNPQFPGPSAPDPADGGASTPPGSVQDPLSGRLPAADPLAGKLPVQGSDAGVQFPSTAPPAGSVNFPGPGQASLPGQASVPTGDPANPAAGFPAAPSAAMPPGVFGTPNSAAATPSSTHSDANPHSGFATANPAPAAPAAPGNRGPAPANSVPFRARTPPVRRRRKSPLGMMFFGVFTLAMLGLVGGILHFLSQRPGGITVTRDDPAGSRRGASSNPEGQGSVRRDRGRMGNGNDRPRQNTDDRSVMDLPVTAGARRRKEADSGGGSIVGTQPSITMGDLMPNPSASANQFDPKSVPGGNAAGMSTMQPVAVENGSSTKPSEVDRPAPTPTPTSMPVPTTPVPTVTPEQRQAADRAINDLVGLIRAADWNAMKAKAVMVDSIPATKEQTIQAETLAKIADLGVYYRIALVRAVVALRAGANVEMAPGVNVVVVEASSDRLVVRRSGKNYRFTLDSIPIKMVRSLTVDQIRLDPNARRAAAAIYQALVPGLNADYRDLAVEQIRSISEDVEGVPAKRMADALARLVAVAPE